MIIGLRKYKVFKVLKICPDPPVDALKNMKQCQRECDTVRPSATEEE